jgi:hypothetical protein
MVDPITILATLCAIISASHSLYEWRHHHLAKRLAANSGQPTEADKQLFAWLLRLWKKYNQIAAVLGKKFHMLLSDNTTNGRIKSQPGAKLEAFS